MNEKYNVYLVSDSTGETLDRIFLSLKSQFANFEYEKKEFAFVRTEQQIDKIIKEPIGGAHRSSDEMIKSVEVSIVKSLDELCGKGSSELVTQRRSKFLNIGRSLL